MEKVKYLNLNDTYVVYSLIILKLCLTVLLSNITMYVPVI